MPPVGRDTDLSAAQKVQNNAAVHLMKMQPFEFVHTEVRNLLFCVFVFTCGLSFQQQPHLYITSVAFKALIRAQQ